MKAPVKWTNGLLRYRYARFMRCTPCVNNSAFLQLLQRVLWHQKERLHPIRDLQDVVLEGVGQEGPPGPSVLELLYEARAMAQFVAVKDVSFSSIPLHLTCPQETCPVYPHLHQLGCLRSCSLAKQMCCRTAASR